MKMVAPSYVVRDFLIIGRINPLYILDDVSIQLFPLAKRSGELRDKLLDWKEYLILDLGRIHLDKNQDDLLKATKKLRR